MVRRQERRMSLGTISKDIIVTNIIVIIILYSTFVFYSYSFHKISLKLKFSIQSNELLFSFNSTIELEEDSEDDK